jgi:hypothetical protein
MIINKAMPMVFRNKRQNGEDTGEQINKIKLTF